MKISDKNLMPQSAGLSCVRCKIPVGSTLDGAFCVDCGNPIHNHCLEEMGPKVPGTCWNCGGDPDLPSAQNVREFRAVQKVQQQVDELELQRSEVAAKLEPVE
ncbi:MAG: hypothetical protein ACFCD0_21775 [Gemmataceae bacterium]